MTSSMCSARLRSRYAADAGRLRRSNPGARMSANPGGLIRFVQAAMLSIQFSGCLVGPDFAEPSASVAAKWLEAGNPSVDTRNQEYRDWWRSEERRVGKECRSGWAA